MSSNIHSDIIRGHINTIILRALMDGDMYGYEIYQAINKRSQGQFSLKQPTLYSALNRLENKGCINSFWGGKETRGGRRKYYSLTELGREIVTQNKEEWEYSRTIIDSLISANAFDLSKGAPVDLTASRTKARRLGIAQMKSRNVRHYTLSSNRESKNTSNPSSHELEKPLNDVTFSNESDKADIIPNNTYRNTDEVIHSGSSDGQASVASPFASNTASISYAPSTAKQKKDFIDGQLSFFSPADAAQDQEDAASQESFLSQCDNAIEEKITALMQSEAKVKESVGQLNNLHTLHSKNDNLPSLSLDLTKMFDGDEYEEKIIYRRTAGANFVQYPNVETIKIEPQPNPTYKEEFLNCTSEVISESQADVLRFTSSTQNNKSFSDYYSQPVEIKANESKSSTTTIVSHEPLPHEAASSIVFSTNSLKTDDYAFGNYDYDPSMYPSSTVTQSDYNTTKNDFFSTYNIAFDYSKIPASKPLQPQEETKTYTTATSGYKDKLDQLISQSRPASTATAAAAITNDARVNVLEREVLNYEALENSLNEKANATSRTVRIRPHTSKLVFNENSIIAPQAGQMAVIEKVDISDKMYYKHKLNLHHSITMWAISLLIILAIALISPVLNSAFGINQSNFAFYLALALILLLFPIYNAVEYYGNSFTRTKNNYLFRTNFIDKILLYYPIAALFATMTVIFFTDLNLLSFVPALVIAPITLLVLSPLSAIVYSLLLDSGKYDVK